MSPIKIKRTLRKLEIKYHKRAPHPDAPDHQLQRIKNLAKYEISKRSKKPREMAEERFFIFSGSKISSSSRFYSLNVKQTPRQTKQNPKTFESKVMIWCAVSNNGVRRVYVAEKGEAMNRARYQCILKSRLGPFINSQCGSRDNFIFWPDLTSSHYATDVQTGLHSENISFVKRENNREKTFSTFWVFSETIGIRKRF